jgi:PAS domain S-box-containing protein
MHMDDFARELVMRAPDAAIVADRTGTIVLWNAGAERIFGIPATAALGQSLDLIIPERQRARHWEGWERVVATGRSGYGERLLAVPALRADGKRLSIEFSIALIPDANGAVRAVGAILRDVTERWERERAAREFPNRGQTPIRED